MSYKDPVDASSAGARKTIRPFCPPKSLVAICLICILSLLFASFLQGVGTGYVFDDITSVAPLHSLREHPELFFQFVFSDISGPLGRPLSIATFAAEQVFLQAGPDLSQILSVALHGANMILVFLLTQWVFQRANVSAPTLFALFAAGLWALTPQKVSSVLYIVQRMTLLSGSCVLLALVTYLCGRSAAAASTAAIWFAASALFVGIAPLAKENGVLALPLIAAVELFLLSGKGGQRDDDGRLRTIARAILLLGVLAFLGLGLRTLLHAGALYAIRSFDLGDRVLYSTLALVDYAKQLFLPDTTRMGLLHDDVLAADPGALAWLSAAVIACLSLTLIVGIVRGAVSLFMLGLAFFLIGHSLESTFLPLELYFEHRNYLPGLGLIMCLVAGIQGLLPRIPRRASLLVCGCGVFYVLALTFSTYVYAGNWSSYPVLLAHELRGHPESARANTEYALALAEGGDYRLALEYIDKAVALSRRYRSARTLGDGDRVALKVAAACLAGRPLPEALPDDRVAWDDDPIQSAIFAVLSNMVSDSVCPGNGWPRVSAWFRDAVFSVINAGGQVRWYALRDLALLERQLGDYTLTYVYANIGAEQRPEDGAFLRLKLEAALAANDVELVRQILATLERLEGQGKLRPVDIELLRGMMSSHDGT